MILILEKTHTAFFFALFKLCCHNLCRDAEHEEFGSTGGALTFVCRKELFKFIEIVMSLCISDKFLSTIHRLVKQEKQV